MKIVVTDGIIEASCSDTTITIRDIINKNTICLTPEEFISISNLAVNHLKDHSDFDTGFKEVIQTYLKGKL